MAIDTTSVYIIYPEKRWVPAETIDTWFSDALANGELTGEETVSLKDKAEALDEAGIITLGRAPL